MQKSDSGTYNPRSSWRVRVLIDYRVFWCTLLKLADIFAPNLFPRSNGFFRMFDAAVSFNQNLNRWDATNLVSVGNMFAGATSFDQSLCWPDLKEATVVNDMFCSSHPGARLNPCCVESSTLIENACCGGNCDTFCSPNQEETRPPFSNDPPEEDGTVQEEEEEEDGTIEEEEDVGMAADSNVNVDTQPPNATTDNANGDEQGNEVAAFEGSDADTSMEAAEKKQNIWQREIWLRISVYIAALLILAGLFLAFLRKRSQPSSSHPAGVEDAASGEEPQKDAEIGVVTTNLTELTDAGDENKEGAEGEKDVTGNDGKEEKNPAPPESPRKRKAFGMSGVE
jgi:Mycoplasma protein of unknown function, DUF285